MGYHENKNQIQIINYQISKNPATQGYTKCLNLNRGVQFTGDLNYLISCKTGAYLKTINDGLPCKPIINQTLFFSHTLLVEAGNNWLNNY